MKTKTVVLNLQSGQPAFVIFADCDLSNNVLLTENIRLKRTRARSATGLHSLVRESGIESEQVIIVGEKCMFYGGHRYPTKDDWTHFDRAGFDPYSLPRPYRKRKRKKHATTA